MTQPRRPRPAARPAPGTTLEELETVARAIDALRAGRPVHLSGRKTLTLYAVETVPAPSLKRLVRPRLILSHARAKTLKIRLYTPDVVALAIKAGTGPETLKAIADPATDLDTPLKGPFQAQRRKLGLDVIAAVKLTKLAGLLPAAVVVNGALRGGVKANIDTILQYETLAAASLAIVTRARVPLEASEKAELVAFRAGDGGPEHVAVVIGEPKNPVLTRLHSECFTGDLLGSLKCDCGEQLRGSLHAIAEAGGGVLLYLAQEGRGIGLINKLRAYRLQDQGFDTIEANLRLGFEADERVYAVAARMLTLLGFHSVRLLTNNPEKVDGLAAAGIAVTERVPHAFASNVHNQAYLRTKAEKAGHLL